MEKRKRKGKAKAPWVLCLWGGGAAIGSYLLGMLLLTLLMMKGVVPEEKGFAFIACFCVLSALLGGWISSRSAWGPLPGALAVTALFAAVLTFSGICWEEPVCRTGEGWILLGCMLGGGVLAGLLCASGKNHRRRKRMGKG